MPFTTPALRIIHLSFQIRGHETDYCIDSMGHTNGGFVELGPCHRMGGNQVILVSFKIKGEEVQCNHCSKQN